MKKIFYVAATAAMLASCSTDFDLSEVFGSGGTSETIGFQVQKGNNVTRATSLQNAGHYNFGVFGYKSTDRTHAVMSNYLVGYFDDNLGYQTSGTTVGDEPGVEDGKSYWMYEGLGKDEYFGTYAGQTLPRFYQSNNSKQFLKYWDKSAPTTCFYAYAPYVGTDDTNQEVTYVDGADVETNGDTCVLNIPNGTLVAGYDDPTKYEYMYAAKKVAVADYGHDVSLDFKRLVAKVNIKFWEDIAGYKVRILDLKQGQYEGVQATPAIHKSSDPSEQSYGPYGYRYGTYYKTNGVKIQFSQSDMSATIKQYNGTRVTESDKANLIFAAPAVARIGETRAFASPSLTDYYAIPKGNGSQVLADNDTKFVDASTPENADLAKTGFTFHVSYELTSDDTGERIVVKNATVHVPYDYCKWKANTHYTYIFKITKNSNGSTDTDPTIDPDDPDVPTVQSLYPIVFDNCTVMDWDEVEGDWTITDGTSLTYHNIALTDESSSPAVPCYSITYGTAKNLTVKISDTDGHSSHAIDYDWVTGTGEGKYGVEVTGPSGTDCSSWYTSNTTSGTIAVPATAAEGVYTVTYYCPSGDINANHPKTWSVNFTVGSAYTITTHHNYVGTKFNEESVALTITGEKDGSTYVLPHGGLSIEYPADVNDDTKKSYVTIDNAENKVIIKKDALPGEYKVVYKTKVNGSDVKVAEHLFYVKDYNFTFHPSKVLNQVNGTTITCMQWNEEISEKAYSCATFAVNNNQITIPNNTNEGTYIITYTIWIGTSDAAQATYTKTFEVENTYNVTLNKAKLDRDLNRGTTAEYGTDYLTVTTLKNGVADKGRTSALKVLNSSSQDVTSNFKITCNPSGDPATNTNTYTLKASKNVEVGNYTLEFKGQDSPERKVTVNFSVVSE